MIWGSATPLLDRRSLADFWGAVGWSESYDTTSWESQDGRLPFHAYDRRGSVMSRSSHGGAAFGRGIA